MFESEFAPGQLELYSETGGVGMGGGGSHALNQI